MTVTKCDRCGKEIPPGARLVRATIGSVTEKACLCDKAYDLCQPCANKLKQFIEDSAVPEDTI